MRRWLQSSVANSKRFWALTAEPEHTQVSRWRRAMAQYAVGHQDRAKRIAEHVAALPGLQAGRQCVRRDWHSGLHSTGAEGGEGTVSWRARQRAGKSACRLNCEPVGTLARASESITARRPARTKRWDDPCRGRWCLLPSRKWNRWLRIFRYSGCGRSAGSCSKKFPAESCGLSGTRCS